jgi:hypothetical protein
MAEIESLLQKKNELWLCCADELTCIHKLSSDRGLLFPITTPQVVREKVYSRLPSYRIGLFTVPEYQDVVLTFLKKALRVYLENSVVETALRYQDLYLRLLKDVTQSLETMNADAAAYLLDAHNQCGDTFYAGVDRIPILAERWSRYVLRLYPEQAAHDLNLPWGQILDRTRELIGPVSIQVRTPTERRAALMYRELPPVIAAEPHSCDDFSIFGAVLGTLSPHVDLLSAKRYQRSEPSSHMGSDNPATVAVGFFAVPPRLFDWRFHRFPIKFRFAGAFISNAEGKQRQRQIQECLELLKVLETGNHQVKPPDDVRVLLLTFGATHNLLRDHGVEGPLFRTVDDTKTPRGEAFLNVVDDCNERDQAAIVIADELTCLEVIGASTKPRRMELLNHRLGGVFADDVDPGAGAYFSVAVRSSASEWVRFFEQSIPLSLESYRESIARSHVRLHGSLKKWTSRQVKSLGPDAPSEGAIEKWCRDVLLLDEPESLTREWTPVLKRAAELLAKSYTAQQ